MSPTFPTFTRPKKPSETVASTRRDETIERMWNFIAGIAVKSLRLYAAPSAGAALVSDSQGNASWSVTLPTVGTLARTGGTITETATLVDAASGEYTATVYAQCTTAGAAGTLDVTFSYTDDIGATTTPIVATIALTATNRDFGLVTLRCSGGGIDYTLTVTGAVGGPVYAAHISITKVR